MSIYINGAAAVSPQNSIDYSLFCEKMNIYETHFLKSIEIDYKPYMTPIEARRMSKIVKDGIASADMAMKQAGIEIPEAIIVGTGLGIVTDTEKFLEKMIEDNEQYLTPTAFIQSTHNTVAAQIAIRLKCHQYNYTFVNRGHSFESALLDALMHIKEGKRNILVGAGDEMTEHYFTVTSKSGFWKQGNIKNSELFARTDSGALCGQGTAFFVLDSQKKADTSVELCDVEMLYKPLDSKEIFDRIKVFLDKNNSSIDEIDLVLTGNNGDVEQDRIYESLQETLFENIPVARFKHLCGEYHTASSFALWLSANMIKTGKYPDFIFANENRPKKIHNILIYNHYANINHSLFLLKKI